MIFDGSSNAIVFSREYFMDFSCSLDLRYYPFDTQVCFMKLMAREGSGFVLTKEGAGILFRGAKVSHLQ